MHDFETIRKALKALKRLSSRFRYGGLFDVYRLACDALEALDRIEKPALL